MYKHKISYISIILYLIFICNVSLVSAAPFKLQPGDLLFQDLNCGILCNGIGEVTYGINNTYMSHIGMVVRATQQQTIIIEAKSNGVVETPLNKFLVRSHDSNGQPMVVVERLIPKYQSLIPGAIKYAKQQLGKPYNATFIPNNGKSYYCSELIYNAFLNANNQTSIFHKHKMSFNDPKNGLITKDWQEYFKQLKVSPPEGMLGTNPGMLSRESDLIVVHTYGNLRTHN